ncbi:MAG: TAXI family TRAP transporter solute-binding subunit [Bdellovibrionales bacterium]
MKKIKFWTGRNLAIFGLPLALILTAITAVYIYVDPAPPKKFVISTGEDDGNYHHFAKQYAEIIKDEGITLVAKESEGSVDNLTALGDPKSGVDAAFVQDGLGSRKLNPGLSSLGSVFYEPIWLFYRGSGEITRFTQLKNKRIGLGEDGGEAYAMAKKLLTASGVTEANATLLELTTETELEDLQNGKIDAAFFVATADNEVIQELLKDSRVHLMSVDQADGISRQIPFLHHLKLPHGAIDLEHNIPAKDVDLVAPTATLVVRNTIHPALVYLLLKAADKTHRGPGMFEARHEFPTDKDFVFSLNPTAKNYYRSGAPFWLRYLPFWLATIVERFIFLVIPLLALIIPILRAIPRFLQWRVRKRIYQRYGELKHLESKIRAELTREKYEDYLEQLDHIEDRVSRMKIPLDFSDYVYSLRGHIHYVRDRLEALLGSAGKVKA